MKKRLTKVIFQVVVCIGLLLGYYFLNCKYNFAIPCIIHKLTGLYCPGCGITRCLFALIKGNIYEAFMYNQLVFILLPFLLFYIVYNIYLYVFDTKDKIFSKIPQIVWIILIIIVVIFGVVRNFEYFDFLRP